MVRRKRWCFCKVIMNLNLKFIREITILLLLAAISGWLGYTLGTNKVQWGVESGWTPRVEVTSKLPPSSTTVDFSLFWMVWNEVFQKYVDKSKLDSQEMVYGAISGMVAALDDPYTVFLPPKENKEAKEQLNGNFEGIGAQLGIKEDRIVVVAPLSGSPAEKAGIKPGDWIIKVNGEETDKWTLPEAVGKGRWWFLMSSTRKGRSRRTSGSGARRLFSKAWNGRKLPRLPQLILRKPCILI